MTFLKSIWADLVEKRLWPVAVALLLALVAIPVLLGGSVEEPVAAPLGATGPTGAGIGALIALDTTTQGRSDRIGALRNPFAQPPAPVVRTAAAASAVAAAPVGPVAGAPAADPKPSTPPNPTGGGGFGTGGATTPPGAPKPFGSGPAAPKPEPVDRFLVALRVFPVGAETPRAKEIDRLTPLPSAERPEFVHLGVLADRRTAVFLLPADVKATGEGVCRPRRSSCETLELQRGDSALLEVAGDEGKSTQYRLELTGIRRTTELVSSAAKAAAAQAAPTATKVPAEEALGSERYRFDDGAGLLRRIRRSAGLGAHLPGAAGAPAAFRAHVPAGEEEQSMLPTFSPGL